MTFVNKKNILLLSLTALFLVLFVLVASPRSISSESIEEIEKEIKESKDALEKTIEEIDKMELDLEASREKIGSLNDGIPRLEAEIEEIEVQMELNKKKLELMEKENRLKSAEIKKLQLSQESSVEDTYKVWRLKYNGRFNFLDDRTSFIRAEFYNSRVLGFGDDLISNLEEEVGKLERSIDEGNETLANLNKENKELEKKKLEIVNRIAQLNIQIATGQTELASLKTQQESLENTIGNLLQEQQAVARREAEILSNTPPPKPPSQPIEVVEPTVEDPIVEILPENSAVTLSVTGKGRDLYQGHGVGMSQWGAYGGALKGMTYQDILSFYYKQTRIEARPKTINVQGYGEMDLDKYAAGLGEVPSKACGTQEQADENPQKYVVDNPNTVWDCWPEEAIKAQVIAARSYASRYSGTICTTAACQVYLGGEAKKWAAEETSNMVLISTGSTHNGGVVNALYSSDNSQGNGTANNDTIFQTFDGNGTPYSYLRAVNDSAFATTTSWTNWSYETGIYSMYSIWGMFDFIANDPSSSEYDYIKNYVRNFISGASNIEKIDFERDPSGRVKKLYVTFDTGVVKSIGGWWFKNIWNNWAYDIGTYDYIYSQTFYLSFK